MRKILTILSVSALSHCAFGQTITASTSNPALCTETAWNYVVVSGITSANESATEASQSVASGTGLDDGEYSVSVFPNPTSGEEINVTVTGQDFVPDSYTIIDVEGLVVQSGASDVSNNTLHVGLSASLTNGTYWINANYRANVIVHEQFLISKN